MASTNSSACERGAARGRSPCPPPAPRAAPLGPTTIGDGAGGDQGRHAVGGRRGVAQVAGQRGAALTWIEPISLAASTTPGQAARAPHARRSPRPAWRRRWRSRHRGSRGDRRTVPAIFLMSTTQVGVAAARAQLHQKVGAARQRFGDPFRAGQQPDGLLDGGRGRIGKPCHALSPVPAALLAGMLLRPAWGIKGTHGCCVRPT